MYKCSLIFVSLFFSLQSFASDEIFTPKKSVLIPIAYYTPETSLAGGFLWIQNFNKEREGKTSNIRMIGSLTVLGQSTITITPTFYLSGGDFEIGGNLKYSYYPDLFYGSGLDGTIYTGEKYTQETSIASLTVARKIVSDLFIRATGSYEKYNILKWDEVGKVADEVNKTGAKYEVPHLEMAFEWDSRDYPQAPKNGAFYRLAATFYDAHNLSGAEALSPFQKYEADLRQYILIRQTDVLALQFLNSEITGSTIPFQYLNMIGGGSSLRGYYEGRFRDQALRLFQIEERHQFDDHWVGTIFVDTARLGSNESALDDERKSKIFTTGGFGVNYILDSENRTKLRADIGFGAGEYNFYFLIGEAY